MSTRSTITIINPNQTAEQSFAHWDGYPAFMGTMLQMCYNTPYKAWHLIKNGAIDHVGFTDHPAKMYQDGVNDNTEYDKIYEPFDGKATTDWQNISDCYTFYYNRDLHQSLSGNKPQHYSAKEVQTSWKYAKRYNGKSVDKLAKLHINASVLPAEEYNYVYDASSAKPQWYVAYSKAVSRDKSDSFSFIGIFEPVSKALALADKDKDYHKLMQLLVRGYHKFQKCGYNPTYQQFCHDMHEKYNRPAHAGVANHSHTQNIVHGQLSLF